MLIPFGNKTQFRPVPDGRVLEQHCTECDEVQRLVECDVVDKVSVFFVSVVDMKSRRMVCQACGEDVDVPPDADARPAGSAGVTPPAQQSAPRQQPSDGDLEQMLADLKKKMGK